MRSLLGPLHILALALSLVMGCGGSSTSDPAGTPAAPADPSGLTADELENGIGPAKEAVVLGEPDLALAETGKTIFEQKCLSCHKMGERFIGPDLTGVLSRRTPRYVMNMILNPEEMVKRHPEAKKLLAEYLAPMAQQNLTPTDARAVLEYIRTQPAPSASGAAQ
jgi:cytochrome c